MKLTAALYSWCVFFPTHGNICSSNRESSSPHCARWRWKRFEHKTHHLEKNTWEWWITIEFAASFRGLENFPSNHPVKWLRFSWSRKTLPSDLLDFHGEISHFCPNQQVTKPRMYFRGSLYDTNPNNNARLRGTSPKLSAAFAAFFDPPKMGVPFHLHET